MNEDQIAYWNSERAARWVEQQVSIDRAIRPYGEAALAAAAVRDGEHALDVGCGCGDTTLALADRVGPGGSVLGLDVSEPMLARARERAAGRGNVRFQLGDAATAELACDRDLLFSRFGVMFFDDPTRAFAQLRRALRPGGRLAFVAWRAFEDNPWTRVPIEAVSALVPDQPVAPSPGQPGPCAFVDRDRVARILGDAGYRDVELERFDASVLFSEGDVEAAVDFAVQAGPVARLLVDASQDLLQRARAAVGAALAPHRTAAGIALGGSSWIVTARG